MQRKELSQGGHSIKTVSPRTAPSLGIFWQALENEQLRRYYGLDDALHSVRARCGLIRPWPAADSIAGCGGVAQS